MPEELNPDTLPAPKAPELEDPDSFMAARKQPDLEDPDAFMAARKQAQPDLASAQSGDGPDPRKYAPGVPAPPLPGELRSNHAQSGLEDPDAFMAARSYAPGVKAPPLPEGLRSDAQLDAERPWDINAKTGEYYQTPRLGSVPVLDWPITGTRGMAEGVEQMAEPSTREKAQGLHKVISGGMEAATPLMVGGLVTAPVRTAATLGLAGLSQQGVEAALKKYGVPPEYAAVIGDVVGLVAGASADTAGEGLKKVGKSLGSGDNGVPMEGYSLPGDGDTGVTAHGAPGTLTATDEYGDTVSQSAAGVTPKASGEGSGLPPEPAPPTRSRVVSPSTPNPPTAAAATVPEDPATIAIQNQQLAAGERRVVMLPKGTAPPAEPYGENVSITSDGLGNTYAYRRDLITEGEIKSAAKNNTLPELLGSAEHGMGAPDKSALQGPPIAVTSRAADGTEVQSTVTDPASLAQTVEATHAVTPEGGTVQIENPQGVIEGRMPDAAPGLSPPPQEAPEAASAPAPPASAPPPVDTNVKLPPELRGAKPRYSFGPKQFGLDFESDLDRAAYITGQTTLSKADAGYLKFVMDATGESEDAIRQYGRDVRAAIKAQARTAEPGSTLRVPDMARERFAAPEPPPADMPPPQTPPPVSNSADVPGWLAPGAPSPDWWPQIEDAAKGPVPWDDVREAYTARTADPAFHQTLKDYALDYAENVGDAHWDRQANELPNAEPAASGIGDYHSLLGSGAIQHTANELYSQDIIPGIKAVGKSLGEMWDGLQKAVLAPLRGAEARMTALDIREAAADRQRAYDVAENVTRAATKLFDRIAALAERGDQPARDLVLDFYTRAEKGLPQANPDFQQAADVLHSLLENRLLKVQKANPDALQTWVENYLPHLYKDPKKVQAFMKDLTQQYAGKRPMAGNKNFLKQRSIQYFEDAIRLRGFEPLSWNPVDMTMMRLVQMDKYIMAHTVFNDMKSQGLLLYLRSGEKLPEGHRWIDDDLATVYGPRQGAVKLGPNVGNTLKPNDITVLGRRTMGRYAAPEQAARVINNFLSPGLRENEFVGGAYKAWVGSANWLNQFQLGFSAFHAGFTSVDAVTSKVALALVQASRGDFGKAAKSLVQAPLSFITQPAGIGNKLVKEWNTPGSQGPAITELANAMKAGGWRGNMDRLYKTQITANMMKAWRSGNVVGAGFRLPFAFVEQAAKPVLEWLVPRQKAAVVADFMRYEMEKNPNMSHQQLREVAAKAVDSADNRMGELTYDNLFWNRMFKDLAHASVRSVGWGVGTVNEIGGGIVDARKLFSKNPELTYRTSYIPALVAVTGSIGGLMTYALTGTPPSSEDGFRDYFFPRTGNLDEHGNPERVSLPSYMKDIYHYATDPGKTLTNKVHPALNLVADIILHNADFYDTEIRNVDDGPGQQALDVAKFVAKQSAPFSITGAIRQHELGTSPWMQAANFIGITPAPSSINKTDAQKLADQFSEGHRPVGKRTAPETARIKVRSDIVRAIRLGHDPRPLIADAKAQGLITQRDVPQMQKRAKVSPLAAAVSSPGMTIPEILKVYEVATPAERNAIKGQVQRKLVAARSRPWEWTDKAAESAAKNFNIHVPGKPGGEKPETSDLGMPPGPAIVRKRTSLGLQ